MRPEKKFLVDEVEAYLDRSSYAFLTDFQRLNVTDTADLRQRLAKEQAEFHVVKNRIFKVAAEKRALPDMSEHLTGQTGIVVGGDNPSEVAKILFKYFKDKEKNDVKAGLLDESALNRDECEALTKLPTKDELRAKLAGMLTMPATNFVRTLNAPAQGLVTCLNGAAQGLLTVLKAREGQLAEG
ncbi:MAG: 50S ribosomal protein L10 [Opitutales bacterium]